VTHQAASPQVMPALRDDLSDPVVIGAEAYTPQEYARAERDKLWRKVWLQAGRVEEIPNVGDFLTYEILEGMKSLGFGGAKPNPYVERSIGNFHRNLAKYIGTGAPRALE
jgi:hypothetical protein